MMKICPRCIRTYAGGESCYHCGAERALLDIASEEAREFLRDPKIRHAVVAHYAERRGMVVSVFGAMVGLLGGIFWLRYAVGAESAAARAAWLAGSAAWGVFFGLGAVVRAFRLARAGNRDVPSYVCENDGEAVEPLRPAPRRGFGWLTW